MVTLQCGRSRLGGPVLSWEKYTVRLPPKGLHHLTRDLLARIQARKSAHAGGVDGQGGPDSASVPVNNPPLPPSPLYFPQEGVAPAAPCVACDGTRKNSRGGACYPCLVREND